MHLSWTFCERVLFIMLLRSFRSKASPPRPSPRMFLSAAVSSARGAQSTQVCGDEAAPGHSSFSLVGETYVAEYSVRALTYEHIKTGAQVLSLISSDNNKVFGITFKTPPTDSTGLPHVMEHSVLCGSRKYRTKEPFVHLLKGSLNTFLNAFTYPDRTCYPVASMNSKDFYNLIDVYLDAVFYPRAIKDPKVLAQEGWHFALENKSDPLTYKGVVYNEMKGVYSSPEAVLSRVTQLALFPDTAYGHDSGGDPAKIPDMTFESFVRFHSTYYHPTNSRIFFYGDDDPLKRLELVDEYLKGFEKLDVSKVAAVEIQPKFREPKYVEMGYPTGQEDEKKHITTINWVLNDSPLDPTEKMALAVLNHLLFANSDSAMRKVLMESNLGDGIISDFSDELLQATLEVGMKGVVPENVKALQKLILDTFSRLSSEGFEDAAVKASMNTVEFHMREFNTGGYPKGLSLMLGVMPNWIYNQDPVESLRFEAPLAELKAKIAAGAPVFQDLIKKFILTNSHRVVVDMKPDHEFESARLSLEESKLASIKNGMSEQEIDTVVSSTLELLEVQASEDSPDAKATLPRLSLSDIDLKQTETPIVVEDLVSSSFTLDRQRDQHSKLLCHALPTSGILYATVAINAADIPLESLELLPIFLRLLTQAGTTDLDSVEMSRRIGSETGGLHTTTHSNLRQKSGVVSDPSDALLYVMLSGKALSDKIPTLFELFHDVLCKANLENQQRAVELLRQSRASRESSVISSGHSYASTRLSAKYSALGYLREMTGGLTYARGLDRLLSEAETDWPRFSQRLKALRRLLLSNFKRSVVVDLTGDEELLRSSKPVVSAFLDSVSASIDAELSVGTGQAEPQTPFLTAWSNDKLLPANNEGFIIPSQVNYVVKGGNLLAPGEVVKGSYAVVARFLNTGYLWDTVRVMGGAYGGSGSFGAASGRYVFSSYRDPNVLNTLRAYDEASKSLLSVPQPDVVAPTEQQAISSQDILEAVIGSIGDLDSPMSPDQKGFSSMSSFLSGSTVEDRQQWRNEILATSHADFESFAMKLAQLKDTGRVVVFGNRQSIEAANEAFSNDDEKMVVDKAFLSKSAGEE